MNESRLLASGTKPDLITGYENRDEEEREREAGETKEISLFIWDGGGDSSSSGRDRAAEFTQRKDAKTAFLAFIASVCPFCANVAPALVGLV